MSITATELKKNLGKYLALSSKEDVYITRKGGSGDNAVQSFSGAGGYGQIPVWHPSR